MATKKIITDLEVVGTIQLDDTNVENNSTVGLNLDINKENTSGAGFASNINGIKAYSKGNSSETIVNIAGVWGKAEHIGTGLTYYITGGTNRAYHTGSGNSTSVSGVFVEAKVGGTGTGSHTYVIGSNNKAVLDNANADVQYLQGMHCTVELGDGDVTDNMTCLLLDADYTGTGTISGDFEYLSLMADTSLPTVGGTARAINSSTTLPSEFAGTIQAPTFYLGSTSSYIRSNAGDTELYAEAGLLIESADGMVIEISDVIDISGGGDLVSDGSISGTSIIKSGGTSSQFLKADGSVDSTVYTGDQDLSGYLLLSGGTMTGDLEIPSKLIHAGDSNTFLQFADDQVQLKAGGRNIVLMDEGADPDKIQLGDSTTVTYTEGTFGIGTTDPQAKLDVDGGIRMANDTTTASADNEGTMRYYTDINGSYMDICMQYQNSGNSANDYKWTNVVRHIFPS